MTKIPFRFTPIPDDMLFDPAVPSEAIVLWAAIYRLTDRRGLEAGPVAIGQTDLGEALGWSVATLRRWLRKTEALGWIVTVQRGKTLANVYQAVMPDRSEMSDQCDTSERTPPAEVSDHSSIYRDRSKRKDTRNDDFVAWYTAYPVHKDRGAAEKAWRQTNGELPALDVLIAATRRYAASKRVQDGYAKNPASWLNAKSWLDEDTQSPAALALASVPTCSLCHVMNPPSSACVYLDECPYTKAAANA